MGEIIPGLNCNNSSQISFDDPSGKAEEFNKFFSKIGEAAFKNSQECIQNVNIGNIRTPGNPVNTLTLDQNVNDNPSSDVIFRPQPVDVNAVILIFKDLNETNVRGCDGIPSSFSILRYYNSKHLDCYGFLSKAMETSIWCPLF